MSPAAALAELTDRLREAGIEEPRREARILAAAAHGVDAAGLLMLDDLEMARITPLLRRREAREPMAYILGRKEFWGLEFFVSPATLIPRPDSEIIVQAALDACPEPQTILDLGTGTGCLLLSCLNERPSAFGIGVDFVPEAAALAAKNAQKLGLASRAAFLAGDWGTALAHPFDLILSNPPYIQEADIPGLMPEVSRFEPASALNGGSSGLEAYEAIIAALPGLLAQNGVAVLELGAGQAKSIAGLAAQAGFACATRQDLSGIERAAILTRGTASTAK